MKIIKSFLEFSAAGPVLIKINFRSILRIFEIVFEIAQNYSAFENL